jgi:hypothetical protein
MKFELYKAKQRLYHKGFTSLSLSIFTLRPFNKKEKEERGFTKLKQKIKIAISFSLYKS